MSSEEQNQNQDPSALRKVYFDAWQKELDKLPLTPLEAMIVDIIHRHPEYHALFSEANHYDDIKFEKFALDHNPFFHLALHVTIAEQVSADHPKGIQQVFKRLLYKHGDKTQVEHKMMECLARVLIDNHRNMHSANPDSYLESLKRLL